MIQISCENILAIDTVTEHCSVALGLGDDVFEMSQKGKKIHSKMVLEMIDTLLERHHLELTDLECLVVDTGPGSFTGVRIGLGVVQGLAYALKIPVIGFNSLEILASSCDEGTAMPLIDARMGQVYCGYYEVSSIQGPVELWPPSVVKPSDLRTDINNKTAVTGNGWQVYENEFSEELRDRVKLDGGGDSFGVFPQARHAVALSQQAGLGKAQSPLVIAASYVRNNVASKAGAAVNTVR